MINEIFGFYRQSLHAKPVNEGARDMRLTPNIRNDKWKCCCGRTFFGFVDVVLSYEVVVVSCVYEKLNWELENQSGIRN